MIDFKKIYENSFSNPNYNLHNDEEFRFQFVKNFILKTEIKTMIDIGSGRGNVLKIVTETFPNIIVESSDLKKFHGLNTKFHEINLCDSKTFKSIEDSKYDLLSCLDVLEHIEKDCVDDVLSLFSKISKYSLLTIANHSDKQNGVELHLIQENLTYWNPIIEKYFEILDTKKEYNEKLYLLTLKSKIK